MSKHMISNHNNGPATLLMIGLSLLQSVIKEKDAADVYHICAFIL